MVPAVGRPACRALLLRHDVGVRAPRQHQRLRAHGGRPGDQARRARGVPGRADLRPLVAGAALRPRPRPARAGRARREAAEGDGRARQPQARRSERPAEGARRHLRAARSGRAQQHHGRGRRASQPGVHPRSGVVRLSVGRAGTPQRAGVVPAGDDAQLGDEPARQTAEHGVRDARREARGSQRTADRQPARRGHRGAAAGRIRSACASSRRRSMPPRSPPSRTSTPRIWPGSPPASR